MAAGRAALSRGAWLVARSCLAGVQARSHVFKPPRSPAEPLQRFRRRSPGQRFRQLGRGGAGTRRREGRPDGQPPVLAARGPGAPGRSPAPAGACGGGGGAVRAGGRASAGPARPGRAGSGSGRRGHSRPRPVTTTGRVTASRTTSIYSRTAALPSRPDAPGWSWQALCWRSVARTPRSARHARLWSACGRSVRRQRTGADRAGAARRRRVRTGTTSRRAAERPTGAGPALGGRGAGRPGHRRQTGAQRAHHASPHRQHLPTARMLHPRGRRRAGQSARPAVAVRADGPGRPCRPGRRSWPPQATRTQAPLPDARC